MRAMPTTRSEPVTPQRLRHLRILPALLAAAALHGVPGQALAQAGPPGPSQLVQWTVESGGNGHWYEFVPSISIFVGFSFEFARNAALASTHAGQPGYLATVTSQQEQDFINGAFTYLVGFGGSGTAWLGASDAAVEGQWRWLDGPEAGQLVGYTNWRQNHPVNQPGAENFDLLALSIQTFLPPTPTLYGWISWPPGNYALGYIVEYGTTPTPIPEPAAGAMLAAGLAAVGWMARRRRAAGR
jgi:hypothetical protein